MTNITAVTNNLPQLTPEAIEMLNFQAAYLPFILAMIVIVVAILIFK